MYLSGHKKRGSLSPSDKQPSITARSSYEYVRNLLTPRKKPPYLSPTEIPYPKHVINLCNMFIFMLFINNTLLKKIEFTKLQEFIFDSSLQEDFIVSYDKNPIEFLTKIYEFINGVTPKVNYLYNIQRKDNQLFVYHIKQEQTNLFIPWFEFYIIQLLIHMGLNVMDMVYMDPQNVFINYYKVYIYTNIDNPEKKEEVINYIRGTLFLPGKINRRLSEIKDSFLKEEGHLKKVDVLVVSHYDYNHNLTLYFKFFRQHLEMFSEPNNIKATNIVDDVTQIKFNNTNGNNFKNRHFTIFACILRNYNVDSSKNIRQESILGFIANEEQYVVCFFDKAQSIRQFTWLGENNKFTDTELSITYNGYEYKFKFDTADKLLLYLNTTEEYYRGEKHKIEEKHKICKSVDVIPQFGTNSWFNSILMTLLYSQGSRTYLLEKINDWKQDNSLFLVLKNILYNSHSLDAIKRENLKRLFAKLRPEAILLKSLKYDKDARKEYKLLKYKNIYSYFTFFIINFLKILKLKFVDISFINPSFCLVDYFKNTKYEYDIVESSLKFTPIEPPEKIEPVKKLKKEITLYFERIKHVDLTIRDYDSVEPPFDTTRYPEPARKYKLIKDIQANAPEYLILFHNKLFNLSFLTSSIGKKSYVPISEYMNNDTDIKKIETYDEIITFNGSEYVLDSCLLRNYNSTIGFHSVACVTCNENKYIYNGMINGTTPCSLIPYKWNVKKEIPFSFHITDDCRFKVGDVNETTEFCYSFGNINSETILIYTKVKRTVVYETDSIGRSAANQNSLSNLSSDIKAYLKENYSREELIDYLKDTDVIDKTNDKLIELLTEKLKKEYIKFEQKTPRFRLKPMKPRTPQREQTQTQLRTERIKQLFPQPKAEQTEQPQREQPQTEQPPSRTPRFILKPMIPQIEQPKIQLIQQTEKTEKTEQPEQPSRRSRNILRLKSTIQLNPDNSTRESEVIQENKPPLTNRSTGLHGRLVRQLPPPLP